MNLQPQTEGNSELGQTLKYHKGHNEIWWKGTKKKSSEHCVYFVTVQTCSIFPSAIANVPSLLPEHAVQSKNIYVKYLSVYEESKHQAGYLKIFSLLWIDLERDTDFFSLDDGGNLVSWIWDLGKGSKMNFNIFLGTTFSICTWSLNT